MKRRATKRIAVLMTLVILTCFVLLVAQKLIR